MEESNQTVFVIDALHEYADKGKIRQVFQLHGRNFAIIETDLLWGIPNLNRYDGDDGEAMPFYLYSTIEEAQEYVKQIRRFEGIKF